MIEIGNYSAGTYGITTYKATTDAQNDIRLTWNIIVRPSYIPYVRTGTHVILQDVMDFKVSSAKFADLDWIQSRFDLATAQKNNYEYAAYLMYEELFHPQVRAQWKFNPINTWLIEGKLTIAGQTIELIKTWALRVKGTFNDALWATISANNEWDNALVKEWSVDYALKLHKAWVTHIKSLGKKTAIIGIVGTDGWNSINFIYPEPLRSYIIQNFDLLVTYTVPNSIESAQKGLIVVKNLRDLGYTGKIIHILTTYWGRSLGSMDEAVQFEEFKLVYPYVNVIIVFPYVNLSFYPGDILYPPILIKFLEEYENGTPCPQSQCDFTITQ